MTTDPLKIPDVEFRGKVRARDHDTSWTAAAKQTKAGDLIVADAIPRILRQFGPLTHDQIHEKYQKAGGKRTVNRIRTATAALVVEGTVWSHDDDGTSANGGPAQRWAA